MINMDLMKSLVISAYDEAHPCGEHKMRRTVICESVCVCVCVRTASHLLSVVSESGMLVVCLSANESEMSEGVLLPV